MVKAPWEDQDEIPDALENPRKPWVAGLLSLAQPGVGHVYVGAPLRGMAVYATYASLLLLLSAGDALATFHGLMLIWAAILIVFAVSIIDSIRMAKQRKVYVLKRYNHWLVYGAVMLTLWSISDLIRKEISSGYRPFKATADSMLPTIHKGENFYSRASAYEVEPPHLRDIVIYREPGNRKNIRVGRVVALAGNTIELGSGKTRLNGVEIEDPYQKQARYEWLAATVPEGSLFILGDNRDNSMDSRTFGPVPLRNVIGKATYIWYSDEWERIGNSIE